MSAEEKQSEGAGEESIFQEQKASERRLESGYYSVVSQMTSDGRLMIGKDVEIFPDRECPSLASPGTTAYEAKDRHLAGEQFVLLCGRSAVPRVTAIGSYKGLKNKNILRLIDAGIVDWASEHRQKFALVFEKPGGKKILDSVDAQPIHVSEDRLIQSVIEPALRALVAFRDVDMVHGAINAENLYLAGTGAAETLILGECLSSAPSWRQNPLYEVPSRAVAQPSGRGPGTITDDLYALGVCVAMIARGENLLRGKSTQQIIYEKIELGSYATVIGRERIPGGISEFLRGVLNDDKKHRWDIDEALQWLEGRRLSPKQAHVVLKAARPLVFHGQKYWDLRSLSQTFSENVSEAASEIEEKQFEAWLKHNFEDKALEARFDQIWPREKNAPRERLVSNMCMALDPFGPVRYKGLSVFPAGFGTALAYATAKGDDIQVYGELISQQFFSAWIGQIFDDVPDASMWTVMLERCRSALTQRMPGYGIERVLYMLSLEVACLSPMLRDHFVLTPGGLLQALEDVSRHADRPDSVLDRHMIAFISVREPKMIDPHFGYINAHVRGHQMIGVIRTLASIQRRFSVGPVPGVCSWLVSQAESMIELLHDRDLREELSKKLNSLQGSGNLMSLLDLVDNPLATRDDAQRFAVARQEYEALVTEKNEIENYLKRRQFFGRASGRQIAMVVSSVLSLVIITAYVVLRWMQMI